MSYRFVEVSFRKAGQLYLFEPGGLELAVEQKVVVETEHGVAIGTVKTLRTTEIKPPTNFRLFRVLRLATDADLARRAQYQDIEERAFTYCKEKIEEHKLAMKLIRVEYFFSGSKILFYFSAEGRIDFRLLVRELARYFRMRIEMRQIGVRDSAKLIDGVGPCGQQLCCSRFLRDFHSVSIRMAKEQNLTLNPQKVTGLCGRLMCCLAYEQDLYKEIRETLPRIGQTVETPKGEGVVKEVFALTKTVQVTFYEKNSSWDNFFKLKEIKDFSPSPKKKDNQSEGKVKRKARRGIEPLMETRRSGNVSKERKGLSSTSPLGMKILGREDSVRFVKQDPDLADSFSGKKKGPYREKTRAKKQGPKQESPQAEELQNSEQMEKSELEAQAKVSPETPPEYSLEDFAPPEENTEFEAPKVDSEFKPSPEESQSKNAKNSRSRRQRNRRTDRSKDRRSQTHHKKKGSQPTPPEKEAKKEESEDKDSKKSTPRKRNNRKRGRRNDKNRPNGENKREKGSVIKSESKGSERRTSENPNQNAASREQHPAAEKSTPKVDSSQKETSVSTQKQGSDEPNKNKNPRRKRRRRKRKPRNDTPKE